MDLARHKNVALTSIIPTTRSRILQPPSSLSPFLLQAPPCPRTPDQLGRPPPLRPLRILPPAQLSLLLPRRLCDKKCTAPSQHRRGATCAAFRRLGPRPPRYCARSWDLDRGGRGGRGGGRFVASCHVPEGTQASLRFPRTHIPRVSMPKTLPFSSLTLSFSPQQLSDRYRRSSSSPHFQWVRMSF